MLVPSSIGALAAGSNANLLFDDEHVQLAPQSYWIAATDQSLRLWNNCTTLQPTKSGGGGRLALSVLPLHFLN